MERVDRMLNLLKAVQKIPGAISMTEAFALYHTILNNLEATVTGIAVDLGSNAGKSSIIASTAISDLDRQDEFHLVDPVYDLENENEWKNTIQGSADKMPWPFCRKKTFQRNLKSTLKKYSNLKHVLYGVTSRTYLTIDRVYSYVFIDSDDHQIELVSFEGLAVLHQVCMGGLVFFHDYGGNYIAPGIVYDKMVETKLYEPVEIDWKRAIKFVNVHDLEKDNNSWHFKDMDNPTFLGCLKRVR